MKIANIASHLYRSFNFFELRDKLDSTQEIDNWVYDIIVKSMFVFE